ncbi:hypothetical protein AF1568 [Thermococcus onnurineus NA1]|uniref:Uncharacterized protein n=1 Tax=Thermococcus onnurineus (strain NA1) TaxID=523850 RepID=B6YSP5_THEON|nr:hypothetical protein [Thermococcus onnurineus]ACJ15582.1 hypothetical protein AF1568 [Thermococcus onnurineus NA1]
MEGRVKKVGAVFLLALLLSLQLIAAPQAAAMTANNSSVTFRRAVVAWYDEKGRLQMNVTWVNRTIDFANLTNTSCPCHNSSSCTSNLTTNVNVSVVTLYRMTEKHEQLLFFGITIYNETFNYTMYVLVYKAERSQYNLGVITRIIHINGTNLFTTMVNIGPRDSKAQPVADIVFFANKTPLADHYRFVGKVLNEIRKNDTTSWIWNKVRIELNDLAKKTERDLGDYNIVGHSTFIIMDDTCTSSCGLICSLPTTPFFCEEYVCAPACTGACEVVCG